MSVVINGIIKGSPAQRSGFRVDDEIISIDGNSIMDSLDYHFYMTSENPTISYLRDGKTAKTVVKKSEFDDFGAEFESYLMDKEIHCKNKCIFCFIDQMPSGMRDSLYFKDDDSRMSFLFGNYVTLTNITRHEIDRIKSMHISPINISVHTTNPELRVKMMANPKAGEFISVMRELSQAGISMNAQLVLCPGINDGDELERSMNDLAKLYPSIQSICAVPVGLTKYREGLHELKGYDTLSAEDVIYRIEKFSDKFLKENGTRLIYPRDEFFLLAKREIPNMEYYEDFPQIDNGVGLMASLRYEFEQAVAQYSDELCEKRNISIATGADAYEFIQSMGDVAAQKWLNLSCNGYRAYNRKRFNESADWERARGKIDYCKCYATQ